MYAKNLHFLLEEAAQFARTIELYFRGTVNQEFVSGSILLRSGDVFQFSLGQHDGRNALALLPRVELVLAVALTLEQAPTSKNSNTPEVHEILKVLQSIILKQPLETPAPTSTKNSLLSETTEITKSVLGDQAMAQLSRIAGQISPEKNPLEFLRATQQLLIPIVGQDIAQGILQPIKTKYLSATPPAQPSKNVVATKDVQNLYAKVESIFQEYFGAGASIRLQKIAVEHPPRERPTEFLHACQSLLNPILGEGAVQKLFKNL